MKFDSHTLILFDRISAASVLLPIIISFIRFKHRAHELKTLSIFLYIAAVFEIIFEVLANYSINNLPFFHFYTIIEFSFLGMVFYRAFTKPSFKKAIIITIITFTAFAVSNALFIQSIYKFNTIARGVESFLLILLALLFFYKIVNEEAVKRLEKYPMFWVNTGILVYFSGSFLLFIFSNYILERFGGEMHHALWGIIHSALNIALNIFFGVGLWLGGRRQ